MQDVAIIGAGPAGATLARLLDPGMKVLLVDRRRVEEGRPGKCCGGLLAPDAQRALAELGLGLPGTVLAGPQLFVVRAIDLPSRRERYYQRHYINMDRGRFESWLLSMVPGRVEVRTGLTLRTVARDGDSFRLTLSGSAGRCEERARIVVGADGAGSRVRRILLPRARTGRTYIAFQEWFESPRQDPHFAAFFDPAVTDFYAWTIPKDGRLAVGAAVRPGPDARARFERFKASLAAVGLRLAEPVRREGALLARPDIGEVSTGQGGVALVGEAGGWISPSSAEGLSYALRSAAALADALRAGPDGFAARYAAGTRGLARSIAAKALKSRLLYAAWLRRAVMAAGIGATRIRAVPPVPGDEGPDAPPHTSL